MKRNQFTQGSFFYKWIHLCSKQTEECHSWKKKIALSWTIFDPTLTPNPTASSTTKSLCMVWSTGYKNEHRTPFLFSPSWQSRYFLPDLKKKLTPPEKHRSIKFPPEARVKHQAQRRAEPHGVLSWARQHLIDRIWLPDCRLMAVERVGKPISLTASKHGRRWFQLCNRKQRWPCLCCTKGLKIQ